MSVASFWAHDDAQAVAAQVQGMIFLSLYVSCSGQAPELLGEVFNLLTTGHSSAPLVLCGVVMASGPKKIISFLISEF